MNREISVEENPTIQYYLFSYILELIEKRSQSTYRLLVKGYPDNLIEDVFYLYENEIERIKLDENQILTQIPKFLKVVKASEAKKTENEFIITSDGAVKYRDEKGKVAFLVPSSVFHELNESIKENTSQAIDEILPYPTLCGEFVCKIIEDYLDSKANFNKIKVLVETLASHWEIYGKSAEFADVLNSFASQVVGGEIDDFYDEKTLMLLGLLPHDNESYEWENLSANEIRKKIEENFRARNELAREMKSNFGALVDKLNQIESELGDKLREISIYSEEEFSVDHISIPSDWPRELTVEKILNLKPKKVLIEITNLKVVIGEDNPKKQQSKEPAKKIGNLFVGTLDEAILTWEFRIAAGDVDPEKIKIGVKIEKIGREKVEEIADWKRPLIRQVTRLKPIKYPGVYYISFHSLGGYDLKGQLNLEVALLDKNLELPPEYIPILVFQKSGMVRPHKIIKIKDKDVLEGAIISSKDKMQQDIILKREDFDQPDEPNIEITMNIDRVENFYGKDIEIQTIEASELTEGTWVVLCKPRKSKASAQQKYVLEIGDLTKTGKIKPVYSFFDIIKRIDRRDMIRYFEQSFDSLDLAVKSGKIILQINRNPINPPGPLPFETPMRKLSETLLASIKKPRIYRITGLDSPIEEDLLEGNQKYKAIFNKLKKNEKYKKYLKARQKYFDAIRDIIRKTGVPGPEFINFASLRQPTTEFLTAFYDLLSATVRKDNLITKEEHSLILLLDTFMVENSSYEFSTSIDNKDRKGPYVVLLPPFHPLRVAQIFRMHELLMKPIQGTALNIDHISALEIASKPYPTLIPVIPLNEGKSVWIPYDAYFTIIGGLWAAYHPTEMISKKAENLNRFWDEYVSLGIIPPPTSIGISEKQIRNITRYYARLYPFKEKIVLGFASTHILLKALSAFMEIDSKENHEILNEDNKQLALIGISANPGEDIALIDNYLETLMAGHHDDEENEKKEIIRKRLEKLSIQIIDHSELKKASEQDMKVFNKIGYEYLRPHVQKFDIIFGEPFSERLLKQHSYTECDSGTCSYFIGGGLGVHRKKTYISKKEGGGNQKIIVSNYPFYPQDEYGEESLEKKEQQIVRFASMLVALKEPGVALAKDSKEKSAKRFVPIHEIPIEDQKLDFDLFHKLSNWVVINSINQDLEFFEELKDRLLIKFSPLVEVENSIDSYFVTSEKTKKLIERFSQLLKLLFHKIRDIDKSVIETRAKELVEATNRVSGDLLLRALSTSAQAQFALGHSFVVSLFEKIGLIQISPNEKSFSCLIALDDLPRSWHEEFDILTRTKESSKRADFMWLSGEEEENGKIKIMLIIIEIKNRGDNREDEEQILKNQCYPSLMNFLSHYDSSRLGYERADQEIKNYELANIIVSSLKKIDTKQDEKILQNKRKFLEEIFVKIASGNFVITFPETSIGPYHGLILSFRNKKDNSQPIRISTNNAIFDSINGWLIDYSPRTLYNIFITDSEEKYLSRLFLEQKPPVPILDEHLEEEDLVDDEIKTLDNNLPEKETLESTVDDSKEKKAVARKLPEKIEKTATREEISESPMKQYTFVVDTKSPKNHSLLQYVRHHLVVGSVGSGKTVLIKVLVEEAILANIPVLIIDQAGDLSLFRKMGPKPRDERLLERWQRYKEKAHVKLYTIMSKNNSLSLPILGRKPENYNELERDKQEELAEKEASVIVEIIQLFRDEKRPFKDTNSVNADLKLFLNHLWDKELPVVSLEKLAEYLENPSAINYSKSWISKKSDIEKVIQTLKTISVTSDKKLFEGKPLNFTDLFSAPPEKVPVVIINMHGGIERSFDDNQKAAFITKLSSELFLWVINANKEFKVDEPYTAKNHPYLLVIDEARDIIPTQKGGKPKEIMTRIIAEGRKYGMGVILGSQLIKDFSVHVRTIINTVFIGKLPDINEIRRAEEIIGEKLDQYRVQQFSPGEFIYKFEKVRKVRIRNTIVAHGELMSAEDVSKLEINEHEPLAD